MPPKAKPQPVDEKKQITIFDYGKKQLAKEIDLSKKKCEKIIKRIDNHDKELQSLKDQKKLLDDHLKDLIELQSKIV